VDEKDGEKGKTHVLVRSLKDVRFGKGNGIKNRDNKKTRGRMKNSLLGTIV